MDISPFYWTIIGEVGVVLIGVLTAIIFVILKDRAKLREYSEYLKGVIKKLKKKLVEQEDEQSQERILELLKVLVKHVREQYQSLYGNEMVSPAGEDTENGAGKPSVEKFVLIAGYQTLIAELSALENSNEAEVTWEKIKNELTPLIQSYLEPVLSDKSESTTSVDEDDSNLQDQLDSANQRIENLEKFKQLYFDLQSKLTNSVEEIENLNQTIAELAEGSDNFADIMTIIEKNKTQYLNMGQMIGMDKDHHHESVAEKMDYSAELINERKDEINRLKHQISQQFEDIWQLQNRLSSPSSSDPQPDSDELSAGVETISRHLKDAELCIETMDMEIQTLTSEVANLQNKLKKLEEEGAGGSSTSEEVQKKEQMIARYAQESKEMMNCITGLEESNTEQSETIKKLENKLAQGKTIEEKYLKLEADYSSMEAKYLEAMSK